MTGASVAIDLWFWPLDGGADPQLALLDAAERARADRFVKASDARRFAAARAGLRERLAGYCAAPPEALHLTEGPNGKPVLEGGPVFNLSHAAGLAALAVTRDPSVWLGIDIEGDRVVDPGLDPLAFAPEERAALAALPVEARAAGFFRGWTRKEAFVKATGQGLHADLCSFAVSLDTPARLLRIDGTGPGPEAWRLHDMVPRPGLAGAIAAMTGGREIAVTLRR